MCLRAEVLSLGGLPWPLRPMQRLAREAAWENGIGRADLGLGSSATRVLGRVSWPLSVQVLRERWEASVVVFQSALVCCPAPRRLGKALSTQHALRFLRFTS